MGGIKGRKQKARLERRIAAFRSITRMESQNPGKQEHGGQKMHLPGSNTK